MSRTEGSDRGGLSEGETPDGVPFGRTAVLLVGHGSHHGAESARPVHLLARRLRAEAAFAEVRVGFWKEDPHLSRAMDLIESSEVSVVPVFTSSGYFTERIVPRELSLSGGLTRVAGRRMRYCSPVGSHPVMAEIVLERAREVAPLSPQQEAAATLVVVGHGTDAHARSGDTTRLLVDRLRDRQRYARVVAAFLDQEPHVEAVVASQGGNVIVVPFFISRGWHVGTTLPGALALEGGRTERGGSSLWYAEPVGTHQRMAEVVRAIVAGGTPGSRAPVDENPAHATPMDVIEAKRDFIQWISAGGRDGRVFLQTVTFRGADGRFEIRHVIDRSRDQSELKEHRDAEGALEVAGLSTGGVHRPLRTAPDLAGGWRFVDLTSEGLWEVFAHLYPAAPVHQYLARARRLCVTPFGRWAARQTGIYAGVEELTTDRVRALTRTCCTPEKCLRAPLWGGADGPAETRSDLDVPCPEPCSVFLSMTKTEEPSSVMDPKPAWESAEPARERVGHALDDPSGRA